MALLFLNLDESSVQEIIVHQYSSGRNGIEILHHLGYLLFFEDSHRLQFFFGSEVVGT